MCSGDNKEMKRYMPPSLSLPPSPASILFALAIFKHICYQRLKIAISLSLATVQLTAVSSGFVLRVEGWFLLFQLLA